MERVRNLMLLIAVIASRSAVGQDIPLEPKGGSASYIVESNLKALTNPGPKLLSALEVAREAVDKERNATGPDSPDLIPLLTRLADYQSKVNERNKVIETQLEALRISEKNFGESDPRTRNARVQLRAAERVARLSDAQFIEFQRARAKIIGVASRAKELSDQDKTQLVAEAHETMRELSGVGSRDCENACKLRCNLALAAKQPREMVEAVDRDLGELKQILGPDDPNYFKPLLMRSCAQAALKDFEAAESGLLELDSILTKVRDADPSDRCAVLGSLTSVLAQTGRLEQAAGTAKKAVEIAQRNSAADPLRLADALDAQGGIALLQNHDDLAIQRMVQAIEIESSAGGRPLKLASLQKRLGAEYVKQKRWSEAEPLCRSSFQIFEKLAGPLDDRTIASATGLATTYLYTEKWSDAESLLKRIHHRTISRSGRDSEESRRIRDALVKTLRRLGKDSEADELLREPRPFVVQPVAAP